VPLPPCSPCEDGVRTHFPFSRNSEIDQRVRSKHPKVRVTEAMVTAVTRALNPYGGVRDATARKRIEALSCESTTPSLTPSLLHSLTHSLTHSHIGRTSCRIGATRTASHLLSCALCAMPPCVRAVGGVTLNWSRSVCGQFTQQHDANWPHTRHGCLTQTAFIMLR
jgi:hypothetical protein